MPDLEKLKRIAEEEFADIVTRAWIIDAKLRVLLVDESFIDFWWSLEIPGRFAHHWERRHIDGTIHRHDNAPHIAWQQVSSFPVHWHKFDEHHVVESALPMDPEGMVRFFLEFARIKLEAKLSSEGGQR